MLLCATAPYLAHVEDDEAAFNATATHRVRFEGLTLAGMSCATSVVRVLPLRLSPSLSLSLSIHMTCQVNLLLIRNLFRTLLLCRPKELA